MIFKDFKNIHKGETFVVLGTGPSASGVNLARVCKAPVIKIGVNLIEKVLMREGIRAWVYVRTENRTRMVSKPVWQSCIPLHYLLTGDPFHDKDKPYISRSLSEYIFVPDFYDHSMVPGGKRVEFKFGAEGTGTFSSDHLDHSTNSPYIACLLAAYMGAKKIGMLGVDFDGDYSGHSYLEKTNRHYRTLWKRLDEKGIHLFNLSEKSHIDVPKIDIFEFL